MYDVHFGGNPEKDGSEFFEKILPNFLKNTEEILRQRGGKFFAGQNVS